MTGSQRRTALASIAAAVVLVALKLGTGLAVGSLALISAGVESSGDVIAAVLTFFAIRLGGRPADVEHPYGHRRAENLAGLGEAVLIGIGGAIVAVEAIDSLTGTGSSLEARWYVFLVIAVALAIDAGRIVVSERMARRHKSAAFHSNAVNFASDFAGSLAVLIGLALVKAGFQDADAIAALVVAVLIFVAVGRLIFENARVLMDHSPESARRAAEDALRALAPEIEIRRLRVRESGGRAFADIVVGVAPGAAVVEGHAAADRVERALHDALPGSDVVVHVEPREAGLALRDRILGAAMAEPLVHEVHDIAILHGASRTSVSLHLKFPADVSLADAHRAADRVEHEILLLGDIDDVQSHLEPLERPLAAEGTTSAAGEQRARRAAELVRERTGSEPRAVRVIESEHGPVLFLTVAVGERSLAGAHRLAGGLEELLRGELPGLAEVVVHTEP